MTTMGEYITGLRGDDVFLPALCGVCKQFKDDAVSLAHCQQLYFKVLL